MALTKCSLDDGGLAADYGVAALMVVRTSVTAASEMAVAALVEVACILLPLHELLLLYDALLM